MLEKSSEYEERTSTLKKSARNVDMTMKKRVDVVFQERQQILEFNQKQGDGKHKPSFLLYKGCIAIIKL
jgi:hypothetical protein